MPHQEQAVRKALLAESARHAPDRVAMLARVERGMAVPAPARRRRFGRGRRALPRHGGLRVAGTAVAISAVLGLSVAVTWAAVGRYGGSVVRSTEPAAPQPVIGSPTSSAPASTRTGAPGRTAPAGTAPAGTPAGVPTGGPAASAPVSSAPGGPPSDATVLPAQGFLWSDGSVDPHSGSSWGQSDVTLKNRGTAMTALDVRLWVALTPGLSYAGAWTTVPNDEITVTVTQQGNGLLYEWRLKPGATVAPGTYEFAGQYSHAQGGRDAGQDTYAADATGAGGATAQVHGDFYPTH